MVVKRQSEVPNIVKNHWIAVITGLASLVVVLSTFVGWLFWLDSRYEKTRDAELREARQQLRNAEQDKNLAISSLWAQFGLTQLRGSFIEDQIFNLTQRKTQLGNKFPAADEAMLQRYSSQNTQVNTRTEAVRRQIDDLNRPQVVQSPPVIPMVPR